MNSLLQAAYNYIQNGICVIPTNKDKIPCFEWKMYHDEIITNEKAKEGFSLPYAKMLGVVCGRSSGNLEVIDIDCKYDLTGQLFDNYLQDIQDNDQDLADSLLIIRTRTGGYHIYYRCEVIEGNQKLAIRPASAEEIVNNPKDKVRVLIETRGQAGYVVAPPSEGYTIHAGGKIPTITADQREILLELARSYNQIISEPRKEYIAPVRDGFFTTPWDDYNSRGDILPLLQAHGWEIIRRRGERIQFRRPGKEKGISGDYHTSLRLFKVFTTSSEFEAGHGYTNYGVYKILECAGDSSQAAKRLIEMGYGEKRISYGDRLEQDIYEKKKQGLSQEELTKYVAKNYPDQSGQSETIVSNLLSLWGSNICTFWDINTKRQPVINRGRMIEFLHKHGGFALFYYDRNSTIYRVVQCKDGFLHEASSEFMKKFIIDYIEALPYTFDGGVTPDDLKDLVLKNHDRLFSGGLLEFLPRGDYDLLKDDELNAYFPFRNGVIRVSKTGIALLGYAEVGKVVWRTQVIDFDVTVDVNIAERDIEYAEFVNCVGGNDSDKYHFACSLIGYLLHKYKDPAKPYCVILAEENDRDDQGGGTGKGIFVSAISKLVNTVRVDGKNFKLDKNFAFQRVGLDTRLIAIEDTRKNVDIEGFYSMITEGITVEKKNKDELFIPYKDSAKILFTTNYSIMKMAAHFKRRMKIFEFAPFFGAEKTPLQHFGHNLFDDWQDLEWNSFYNFMFLCCQGYLADGILETESTVKVRRKHIRLKYGEEFLDWFDEWEKNGAYEWQKFIGIYDEFLTTTGTEKKFMSAKRFAMAINETVVFVHNATIEVERKRVSGLNRGIEMRLIKKSI